MPALGASRTPRRLVLLASVVMLLAGACSVGVLHDLDEPSANQALGALERAGIGARKAADEANGGGASRFTLQVPRGEAARALDVLRAAGLPRDHRDGFAEIYGGGSLIPSPTEDRARYVQALAAELERTLETVDGVVGARVHLVLPAADPMAAAAGDAAPGDAARDAAARAAVLLKVLGSPAPLPVADVQRLVAGSVPALLPSNVTVVVTAAAGAAQPSAPTGALTAVGPLRVTPSSRPLLLGVFAAGLGVIGALAAALFLVLRRRALGPPGT